MVITRKIASAINIMPPATPTPMKRVVLLVDEDGVTLIMVLADEVADVAACVRVAVEANGAWVYAVVT